MHANGASVRLWRARDRSSFPNPGAPLQSASVRGAIAIGAALVVLLISLIDNGSSFRIVPSEAIVLVLASLLLTLRWMIALVVTSFGCVFVDVGVAGWDEALLSVGAILGLVAVSFVGLVGAYRRQALGLGHVSAESVLEKLHDQLVIQGAVPALPDGWHVDVQQMSAHGAAIAGDFVSCRLHVVGGKPHLDLVLVDVSGKGIEAGTRALLLSGAMGGLLGSVDPDEFLIETNNYLRRQSWAEGFASAVYVRVDLETGLYSVRSAGHLPALHFSTHAGAPDDAWRTSTSAGSLLGIRAEISVRADYRTLRTGDVLVLYTDGVVEDPGKDLAWGTDRLMSATEKMVVAGDTDALARRLVETVPTRTDDDRAVVVIRRAPAEPRPL
ncbi:MAG: protein serine/threonine phosphatase [Pseudonocardiales bacterium]|nr:protein serine/threonine phosphatase [Pseudonocardiales bacterium]